MKVELIGALDYAKLKEKLKGKISDIDIDNLIEQIHNMEVERRLEIVSTAAGLSRSKGNVFDVLGISENNSFDKNLSFIKRVIKMGHDSITDHDYLVFAFQDVSIIVEQTVILERHSSFTIKSRREVDFSKVGYYVPNFHDINGNLLANNEEIKNEFSEHEKHLFNNYEKLVSMGISLEDARYILPYSFHSNFIMGIDAHTLKDMIIKFTFILK